MFRELIAALFGHTEPADKFADKLDNLESRVSALEAAEQSNSVPVEGE